MKFFAFFAAIVSIASPVFAQDIHEYFGNLNCGILLAPDTYEAEEYSRMDFAFFVGGLTFAISTLADAEIIDVETVVEFEPVCLANPNMSIRDVFMSIGPQSHN